MISSLTLAYGSHPDQRVRTWESRAACGTAVLLHGGFWREPYDASLMTPLARDLVARGWTVANVEYRRVAVELPVGYPAIFEDVRSALHALASWFSAGLVKPLVLIGHSAGGQLALWAAADRAHALACGERDAPSIDGVVAQAGVVDLHEAARAELGRDATQALLGGEPSEYPERYRHACPRCRLPLGVPQLLVHGTNDEHVPWEMSERYAASATDSGDPVTTVLLDGAGHFDHLDPTHSAWLEVVEWLNARSQRERMGAGALADGSARR